MKAHFDTVATPSEYQIVHSSGAVLKSYKHSSADAAEETKDWANRMACLSPKKLDAEIAQASGAKKAILVAIAKMIGKAPASAQQRRVSAPVPRARSRESYTSAARLAFNPDSLTAKDREVLAAVDELGPVACARSVAAKLNVKPNVVAGAVSVLVAKGIVSTENGVHDGRRARMIRIVRRDWRSIPAPKKIKAA